MTAPALADFKKHIAAHDFHVPWSDCEPTAFPAMITEMGMPIEFLMTPEPRDPADRRWRDA